MKKKLSHLLVIGFAVIFPLAMMGQKKVKTEGEEDLRQIGAIDVTDEAPTEYTKPTVAVNEDGVAVLYLPAKEGFEEIQYALVPVKAGIFKMGATSDQGKSDKDEKPAFLVKITKDFFMGETEVPQRLWEYVMGSNPSTHQDESGQLPVENIQWEQAREFCQMLSGITGRRFRLPTEAEWEYAARGGHKIVPSLYSGSSNINEVGWYEGNSNYNTHPVKQLAPNPIGLYDMSGNVWEFCEDTKGAYPTGHDSTPAIDYQYNNGPNTDKLRRGGSWNSHHDQLRVAYRRRVAYDNDLKVHTGENDSGVRIVLEK